MEEKLQSKENNCIRIVFGDVRVSFPSIPSGDVTAAVEEPSLPEIHVRELHKHPFYEFRFTVRGTFPFDAVDRSLSLPTGEMLVLCPETYHYSYIPSDEFETLVVSCFFDKIEEGEPKIYDTLCLLLDDANMKNLVPPAELLQKVSALTPAMNTPQSDVRSLFHTKALATSFVLDLFDLIHLYDSNRVDAISKTNVPKQPNYVVALDFFVHSPRFSLTAIAAALSYSPKHTSRLIKQTYGATLTQIRKEKKLSRARALLLERPDLDIQQICNLVGFSSASLFYSVFRQSEGCPPNEYRKQHGITSGTSLETDSHK